MNEKNEGMNEQTQINEGRKELMKEERNELMKEGMNL
jgi:hypothetical protein